MGARGREAGRKQVGQDAETWIGQEQPGHVHWLWTLCEINRK